MYHSLFRHVPVRSQRHLDRYFRLIEHYIDNPHQGTGERHHVLPRAFGGIDGPVVLLPYRAHFIAHWMLWKATESDSMTNAFFRMKYWDHNIINSRTFEILKEEFSQSMSRAQNARPKESRKWWNNGIVNRQGIVAPGPDFVPGRCDMKTQKPRAVGKVWWTDGTNNCKSKDCPGDGWERGKTVHEDHGHWSIGKTWTMSEEGRNNIRKNMIGRKRNDKGVFI